jgi:hypothetical protein
MLSASGVRNIDSAAARRVPAFGLIRVNWPIAAPHRTPQAVVDADFLDGIARDFAILGVGYGVPDPEIITGTRDEHDLARVLDDIEIAGGKRVEKRHERGIARRGKLRDHAPAIRKAAVWELADEVFDGLGVCGECGEETNDECNEPPH